MARRTRVWYPDSTFHVMSRGNRRMELFRDRSDCLKFLECLKEIREKYPFTIHSMCLMTNHFHIELGTHDVEIWKIMQRILGNYAAYFNRKYSGSGHVFESRYTSSLIEDDGYFLEASRYIHLNPVKAGMVPDPCSYEYSSYKLFVSDESVCKSDKIAAIMSELVDTSLVLSAFGPNPRQQYRTFVEGNSSHIEKELLIMKDMKEDEYGQPC